MKCRRGVTLIEMLIAMSVVSCVLIAVLNVFNFSTRLWNNQVGNSKSMAEANLAMELICKEIGSAVSYQNDSSGNPSIFTLPANTDASGNYIPISQSGSLTYASGVPVQFYLGDKTGRIKSSGTQNVGLWRQTAQSGGLLGGLLGGLIWTPDTNWSYYPGGSNLKYPYFSALIFTTTGMPANTVQVTLTVTTHEGGQASSYTLTRDVYLTNHN